MEGTKTRPDRTLVVILSVIALLIVASVAAVLSRGEPDLLDASTPEGVVQRYATAVIGGDDASASEFLTDDATELCTEYARQPDESIRVSLADTTVFDHAADVEVTIVTTYGAGPFGVSEYQEQATFGLVRVDGVWKIDTVPWQLTISCQGVNS
jgi:hypothetical protein